jgi:hypothetical protein
MTPGTTNGAASLLAADGIDAGVVAIDVVDDVDDEAVAIDDEFVVG